METNLRTLGPKETKVVLTLRDAELKARTQELAAAPPLGCRWAWPDDEPNLGARGGRLEPVPKPAAGGQLRGAVSPENTSNYFALIPGRCRRSRP
jgi:hypothetical protein